MEKVYCSNCEKYFMIPEDEIWVDLVVGDPYHGGLYSPFVNCPECNDVIGIIPDD